MQQQQQQSDVDVDVDYSAVLEETVQNAERYFVLKDYQGALKLSLEAMKLIDKQKDLSSSSLSSSEQEETNDYCIRLQSTTTTSTTTSNDDGTATKTTTTLPQFVSLTSNVSLGDRAAVVALQSGHELSSSSSSNDDTTTANRSTGQTAFVNFYSSRRRRTHHPGATGSPMRGMPVDVAIVWIQYSFQVLTNIASSSSSILVETTAELLYRARQYYYSTNVLRPTSSEDSYMTTMDDLCRLLLVDMLPFSKNSDYVLHVLDRIDAAATTTTWMGISSSGANNTTYVRADEVNHEAVSVLLSRLDTFSFNKRLKQCRKALENLIATSGSDEDCQQLDERTNDILAHSQQRTSRRPSSKTIVEWMRGLATDNWSFQQCYATVLSFLRRITHLLDWFRTTTIRMLVDKRSLLHQRDGHHADSPACLSTSDPRVRVAMSVLLLYLAWKRRRVLMQWTKRSASTVATTTTALVVAPVREVVDALLPTSSSRRQQQS